MLELHWCAISMVRRPKLEGDNMWRGHAAAFLRHARLQPNDLLQGRVLQVLPSPVSVVVWALLLKIKCTGLAT